MLLLDIFTSPSLVDLHWVTRHEFFPALLRAQSIYIYRLAILQKCDLPNSSVCRSNLLLAASRKRARTQKWSEVRVGTSLAFASVRWRWQFGRYSCHKGHKASSHHRKLSFRKETDTERIFLKILALIGHLRKRLGICQVRDTGQVTGHFPDLLRIVKRVEKPAVWEKSFTFVTSLEATELWPWTREVTHRPSARVSNSCTQTPPSCWLAATVATPVTEEGDEAEGRQIDAISYFPTAHASNDLSVQVFYPVSGLR